MTSNATTVEEYLNSLPEDRRAAIRTVREVILKNLPKGYEEGVQYGMIGYYVPHSIFPAGYHCNPKEPLPFASLASQKNYMAIYLCTVYGDADTDNWFQEAWAATGKRFDMGKSCIRFKKIDDLALDVIGEAIARAPLEKYVAHYEGFLAQQAAKRKK